MPPIQPNSFSFCVRKFSALKRNPGKALSEPLQIIMGSGAFSHRPLSELWICLPSRPLAAVWDTCMHSVKTSENALELHDKYSIVSGTFPAQLECTKHVVYTQTQYMQTN